MTFTYESNIRFSVKYKAHKNDRLRCATFKDFMSAVRRFNSEMWDNVYVIAMTNNGDVLAIFDRFANGNKLICYNGWFDFDTSLLDD